MVSRPELGPDPSFGSGRESGRDSGTHIYPLISNSLVSVDYVFFFFFL